MANHHNHQEEQPRTRKDDPFLLNYNAADLRIASEFLFNWLPFLSRGLCRRCTQTLSDRIRSLDYEAEENSVVLTLKNMDINECEKDNCDTTSFGSWKDDADVNDTADTNSLGSWKDGADGSSEPVAEMESEASTIETPSSYPAPFEIHREKMSWADMAQEDELEAEEENDVTSRQVGNMNSVTGENLTVKEVKQKTQLSRDQREYIRFTNVKRKKDFMCLERVKGRPVNILDGLELHTGVFSAAEQKRIVDYVEVIQEKGKKGELKPRTLSAPQKWMRGKGRVTIQFGCCYNYAVDKDGNYPGILRNEVVDALPNLFKVMIKRLIRWHVLPPSCVPDSCIVNIYDEGDCIPPHIDNHDFVRPFCTVSFLSECNILFGSDLKIVGPGEFSGSTAIPLPVGSVLVLSGNGADIAKHCVPAVPTKRISITFRKMDESKRPIGYVPEPDLQGLQPLSYGVNRSRGIGKRLVVRRDGRDENSSGAKGPIETGSNARQSNRTRQGSVNRRKARLFLET